MIAVIDVCGNNLTSLGNALKRLGYTYKLTHDAADIMTASQVIIPGVGAAKPAMQALLKYDLVKVIKSLNQPVLGICLGMQLLFDYSEEGNVNCLGLIPGVIKRLPVKAHQPVPHMGWNKLLWARTSSLSQGLPDKAYVYFVHSYAHFTSNQENELARCHYSEEFSAIVQRDNIFGMQFHPEKSAETGLILLNNFLQKERA